jgi:hypothetical protein
MSIVQKTNGSHTDPRVTTQCIQEHRIPKGEVTEKPDHHKTMRTLIEKPVKRKTTWTAQQKK